jgi:hypothetical protein
MQLEEKEGIKWIRHFGFSGELLLKFLLLLVVVMMLLL